MSTVKIQLPEKAADVLLPPARYKVLYGGRGSGKSHSAARYLLVKGIESRHRILCTREVQKSIRDSVHKLLADQIEEMGIQSEYEVLEAIIRGRNGTEFLFNGLSNQTAGTIKSFEGVTKCWCEEAQVISKRSWEILIPTIRAEGSEFIITFNPELDTDDTYRRFIINPPPGTRAAFVNYYNNPFFPQVLEQEREHCKATAPLEDYNNIWEGHCRSAVSGAIYANEVATAIAQNRVGNLPYDPGMKVHVVCDMGFGDNMVGIFVQRLRSEIRVIDYIQVRYTRTDEFGVLIQQKRYNMGYVFLPHDGYHVTRGTGMSDSQILQRMGFRVKRTPNIPREDGIRALRNVFHQLYFDRSKCELLLECLKRYRRAETKAGGDGQPVHNEHSDGADAARYMALNVQSMTNEDSGAVFSTPAVAFQPSVSEMGY